MIRLTRYFGLAAALMMVIPISAQALSINVVNAWGSGASATLLMPGDTITVDLTVENAGGLGVYGLGLGVRGYDANTNGQVDDGLSYVSGQSAESVFNVVRQALPLPSLGGLSNLVASAPAPLEQGFFNPVTFASEEKRVLIFNGVDVSPHPGLGTDDVGIGGGYTDGIGNDVHFRVVFQATPVQVATKEFTLVFGTMAEFGAVAVGASGVTAFGNDSLTFSVIPEPGTALLMGLGLIGLSSSRRR